MKGRLIRYITIGLGFAIMLGISSCEEFFNPTQGLVIQETDFFNDWYDYRSAEMGLYALQQNLAEQLLILGELRGDLLEVTENASRDLIEIQNFKISEFNKYASSRGFYELIAGCNNLQRTLEHYHPEVMSEDGPVTNYDRLYGEIIVMRSWAYFNAVRIYGSIPYIPISLTAIDEIEEFVNSPVTIVDSFDILFAPDGRYNDTIFYDTPITLTSAYLNLDQIVDSCTNDILSNVKVTGVNHYIENGDASWEVTVWNEYAMEYLLGQMYLFQGNLLEADRHFERILSIVDIEADDVRYGLDKTFSKGSWKNILTSINQNEHIFVIWFGKGQHQTNEFQKMFSTVSPNSYELKPTRQAVHNWETNWDGFRYWYSDLTDHSLQALNPSNLGTPGDIYRGANISYAYTKNGIPMSNNEVMEMLELKRDQNDFEVEKIMKGIDTVVYKYTLGKQNDPFARDANFIVARAASVHLYAAELYTYFAWVELGENYVITLELAEQYLNNGFYNGNSDQLGVRGRVGFTDHQDEEIHVPNIVYTRDPFTNEVNGYIDFTGNLAGKQDYLEEQILAERARELAFEGERFYDLMRIAKRRGDNTFLADKVAEKFSGAQAEEIRTKLMNESNWYLPFYLGTAE